LERKIKKIKAGGKKATRQDQKEGLKRMRREGKIGDKGKKEKRGERFEGKGGRVEGTFGKAVIFFFFLFLYFFFFSLPLFLLSFLGPAPFSLDFD